MVSLKTLLKTCYPVLIGIMDYLVSKIPSTLNKRIFKKVLVVRMDEIGDFILWSDAAKALRSLFPKDQYLITLIGNTQWMPIAKKILPFDNFVGLRKSRFYKNPFYRLYHIMKIRLSGYSIALNPHYSRNYYFDDTIIRVSRSPQRIAFSGDLSNISARQKQRSDTWYTNLLLSRHPYLMEIERNAEFVRALGADNFSPALPVLPPDLNPGISSEPYYVLFPGARNPFRCWPTENFALMGDFIFRKTGLKGLICGGPDEKHLSRTILDLATDIPLDDLIGKTTINQLVDLLRDAVFLISNDTSAVHIASAVSTPSFCLLGGGYFGRFLPYSLKSENTPVPIFFKMPCFGCGWKCIFGKEDNPAYPCLSNIKVEHVQKVFMENMPRF